MIVSFHSACQSHVTLLCDMLVTYDVLSYSQGTYYTKCPHTMSPSTVVVYTHTVPVYLLQNYYQYTSDTNELQCAKEHIVDFSQRLQAHICKILKATHAEGHSEWTTIMSLTKAVQSVLCSKAFTKEEEQYFLNAIERLCDREYIEKHPQQDSVRYLP